MITQENRDTLKNIIGNHYSDEVLEILNNKAIRNKNGHPHNAEYVRMVFQGYRYNKDVEAAIWELAANRKKELNKIEAKKKQVLDKAS